MAHVSHFAHIMLLVMAGIYGNVLFGCYVPFYLHVAKERWKEGGEILGWIRKLVAVNLTLGLFTIAVVDIGRV
jgi:uncharacterized membrane protein